MIDASIYRGIQQPQAPDQMANYGRMLQIRQMMDQGELAGIQRNKLIRDMASDEEFRKAFDGYDPANPTQTIAAMFRADPMRAVQFQKTQLEKKKLSGEIEGNQVTRLANATKLLRDRLATVRDDEGMAGYREDVARLLGPQFAARIPQTYSPEFVQSEVMTADKLIERMTPKYERVDMGGSIQTVDVNPFTNPAIRGQTWTKTMTPGEAATDQRGRESNAEQRRHNLVTETNAATATDRADWQYDAERVLLVNKRTGATKAATGADGQPIQTTPKLTEAQGNATAFGMRARESADIINKLETTGTFGRVEGKTDAMRQGLERVPVIGTALGNTTAGIANQFTSNAQLKYAQAKRDFINAVLRKESGATITPQEFDNADRQYFPQAGDSEGVIKQKRDNREMAIRALRVQAGQGASNIPQGVDVSKMSDAEIRRELGL